MPSGEEMRKCPAGAIAKHTDWEKRNKGNIAKWKENQLRLNPNSDDPDLANFEKFRPTQSTLNMHNEIVEGQQFHGVENASPAVVFSDSDLALIKQRAPEKVANGLCFMDADQRKIVKQQFIDTWVEPKK